MYLEFLKAYKQWIDDGAPEGHPTFHRSHALCGNLERYIPDQQLWQDTMDTMRARMVQTYGDHKYPFSKGDTYEARLLFYEDELLGYHLNPRRIAFVDAEIERLESMK